MSGGSVRIPTGERNRDRDKEEGQSKLGVVADKCAACGNAFQTKVIGGLEVFFDAYGRLVARRPIITIVISLVVALLCISGMTQYYTENDGKDLWLPRGKEFTERAYFMSETFQSDVRSNHILVAAERGNILSADNLRAIYRLREAVTAITTDNGATWENRCRRVPRSPSTNGSASFSISDLSSSFVFPTLAFPEEVCAKLAEEEENADWVCQEEDIFEIWANDGKFDDLTKSRVEGLSDEDVLEAINARELRSGLTGTFLYPAKFLGTVKRDSGGRIVSARGMTLYFGGRKTDRDGSLDHDMTRDFEGAFIDTVNGVRFSRRDLKAFPNAHRSYNDVVDEDTNKDLNLFFFGYLFVTIYVMSMLGKFNGVETRIVLSIAGILCIVLGLGASFGVGSYIGWFSSTMNQIMPFLVLGIGIDDMFVIVQNFDNLGRRYKTLEEKIGHALKHAGVAISITTLTDVMAFAVGASTSLPALRNFCLYSAFSILFVYFFMLTFFLGFFVLDQRRMESRRHAIFCCYRMDDKWRPNECSQRSLLHAFFEGYSRVLLNRYVRIAVIALTLLLLGVSVYGIARLEADFDEQLWVPKDTYLRHYIDYKEEYFPSGGMVGDLFMINVKDISQKMDVVKKMRKELTQLEILSPTSGRGGFDDAFERYVDFRSPSSDYPESGLDEETFHSYLAEFLYTVGQPYQNVLRFARDLECEERAPKITLLSVPFRHKRYESAAEHVKKMNEMNDFAKKYESELDGGKSAEVYPMCWAYGDYVLMEVIVQELYRNVILAMVCVFVASLVLIANLTASLIVAACVFMALIDVGGFMYLWGLSIDTVAAVLITIALGLAVDYSAHIAHSFMVKVGSREERVRQTLVDMGPAVLNGGVSTFLAFVMLVTSKTFIFLTFFKIFFLVVTFGLYHGLVFLPVVLSYVGPPTSYSVMAKRAAKVEPITGIPTITEGFDKVGEKSAGGGSNSNGSNGVVSQNHL